MLIYFLNIEGPTSTHDDEGLELQDLSAAEKQVELTRQWPHTTYAECERDFGLLLRCRAHHINRGSARA